MKPDVGFQMCEVLLIRMSMTGNERRILEEIEQALMREDPAFAERIATIYRIECGEASPAPIQRRQPRIERRVWILLLGALTVIVILVSAVLMSYQGPASALLRG
ncbi:hypothetical protein GCM10010404_39240 [Nonomuraea africana]|uniref:DUF3040 domain-containing protein n=1 Tax=Nonomuraea africana TaxID=46171 RepID=A0ABR9KV79_9ACTN|nr:DUF3040 domain-containing protein [Nonomuraea africana]MBE1565938.1 hypothetical protein [Nonomuraea africana]